MITLIVIGCLVAYAGIGAVAAGVVYEKSDWDMLDSIINGTLWPLTLIFHTSIWVLRRPAARLFGVGERIAKPRALKPSPSPSSPSSSSSPKLPKAKVVK